VALGQHLSYQMQGLIFVLFLLGGCKIEWTKVWQETITFLVQNDEFFLCGLELFTKVSH
jgi:hypothetical protein